MRSSRRGQRLVVISLSLVAFLQISTSAQAHRLRLSPPPLATVIFTSDRDGMYPERLYSATSDGENLRELASGVDTSSWSPDGRRLAVIEANGSKRDLALIGANGERQPLETGGDVQAFAWSPGGRKIVYESGPYDDRQVAVIDVLSGQTTAIGPGSSPQFTPDGKHLSFFRVNGKGKAYSNPHDLWVANPDGSHAHRITLSIDGAVKWSPDGRHVAFVRSNALVIDKITASPETYLPAYATNVSEMSWSPTGKRLVYETHDGLDSRGATAWSAFVIDVNAKTKPRRVFKDISAASTDPAWSPRISEIALTAKVNGQLSLYLIHPDGKGRRRILTDTDGQIIGTPVWSRDGHQFTVYAGYPRDVWVIDSVTRWKTRISQGWHYGYASTPVRLFEHGPSVAPGTAVEPQIPTNTIVDGMTLKTIAPPNSLAADGDTVAIHYRRGEIVDYNAPRDYRCLETWNPLERKITRFAMQTCERTHYSGSLGAGGFVDLTLAGERVAWSQFYHFAGLDIFDLYTATNGQPRPDLVPGVCPDNPYGDCLVPESDLQGDGSLLVFDIWQTSCSYPTFPDPCSTSPKKNGRLFRVDANGTAALITTSTGALTPLSVDSGRVLVDHEGGAALELLDSDDHSLAHFSYPPAGFITARVNGSDVAVFGKGSVSDYDAASGALKHTWPLGCGDETSPDIQNGLAVYLCGRYVHLLSLQDGRDIVLPALGEDPYVQLEAAGLYYAYTASDPAYQGRVTFTPWSALPRP